jgi:nicotinamidase-related amidase
MLPTFFDPAKVAKVWPVPYPIRAEDARRWARQYQLKSAGEDRLRVALLLVDVQNTFCLPEFELYVKGAIEDNIRLCSFIYHNIGEITEIIVTQDTHSTIAIFHPIFWVDRQGLNPGLIQISLEDVECGDWRINPAIVDHLALENPKAYALHYLQQLKSSGKYELTIWPYHALLGSIGHALVSAVQEALFFHSLVRQVPTRFELKGNHPLTEHYSVFCPEVVQDERGRAIATKNKELLDRLLSFDALVIAGQAKSHCLAWTVRDLLQEAMSQKPEFVQRIYLLEDCTSPVVISPAIDYTQRAEADFASFAADGVHLVRSTTSLYDFPGLLF